MSDRLHDTLSTLRTDVDSMPLADSSAVRARGAQRTRRQAVGTSLAVVALVAGAVGIGSALTGTNKASDLPRRQADGHRRPRALPRPHRGHQAADRHGVAAHRRRAPDRAEPDIQPGRDAGEHDRRGGRGAEPHEFASSRRTAARTKSPAWCGSSRPTSMRSLGTGSRSTRAPRLPGWRSTTSPPAARAGQAPNDRDPGSTQAQMTLRATTFYGRARIGVLRRADQGLALRGDVVVVLDRPRHAAGGRRRPGRLRRRASTHARRRRASSPPDALDAPVSGRGVISSRIRRAVSDGVLPTLTPTASSASFLAAAVPDEPETIAPAWPIVLPSGAVKPAT